MRKFLLFLFVLLLHPATAAERGADTVLILGDSLSAGYGLELDETWVALLERRLAEEGYEYRVMNASISGDTSSGGLARLGTALERHRPALVVIELGGNDALRGLPLGEMRRNFRAMIEASRAAGAGVVLLGMRIPPNYGPRYAEEFHSVYGELAAEYGIGLVDFFLEGVALDRALMQSDGIHPNAAAQRIMLDNAWPAIEAALDERR